MKRLIAVVVAGLACAALAGCASEVKVDVSTTALAVATHEDLLAAAKYADDHGYPARAAVWRAHDAHLSAVESQISACANAIAASLPAPRDSGKVTPFLAVEMSAEAVGNVAVPPAVKINCEPFPLLGLPGLPRLPL